MHLTTARKRRAMVSSNYCLCYIGVLPREGNYRV
jgi:hypothetical protein